MRKLLLVLSVLVLALVLAASALGYNDDPGGAIQCHWVCGFTMNGYQCWTVWW